MFDNARERWQEYRHGQEANRDGVEIDKSNVQNQDRSQGKDDDQSL